MGLYSFIDNMCGVDEYSYDLRKKALKVKVAVTAFIAIMGIWLLFGIIIPRVVDLFAPPLIYIGKIETFNIQEDKTTLKVKSLIEPANGFVKWFGLADEVIWTGVKEPGEENKKMLMVSQFNDTFVYGGNDFPFKQGDIVKIYAKNQKIKEITIATERDITNGRTIVIRGKLKSYQEGSYDCTLTLSITNNQIEGNNKSCKLIFKKNGEINYIVGKQYEFIKAYDSDNWTINEIDS